MVGRSIKRTCKGVTYTIAREVETLRRAPVLEEWIVYKLQRYLRPSAKRYTRRSVYLFWNEHGQGEWTTNEFRALLFTEERAKSVCLEFGAFACRHPRLGLRALADHHNLPVNKLS